MDKSNLKPGTRMVVKGNSTGNIVHFFNLGIEVTIQDKIYQVEPPVYNVESKRGYSQVIHSEDLDYPQQKQ